MRPSIGKRAFIPTHLIDYYGINEVQSSLLFKETSITRVESILGTKPEDKEVTINEYRKCRGGVTLPRAFAFDKIGKSFLDNTSNPYLAECRQLFHTITPRDSKQRSFFSSLIKEAKKDGPQSILAVAATGSGKTVAGIKLGLSLNTRTLIIVDSNKIAKGWLNNFTKFFGKAWTDKNVGRIQQDKCEYGKMFSIALAQSLASRRYNRAMYKSFGCVVFDEVQVFGGKHFSSIFSMFNARVIAGFTAENRKGQFGRLIKTHLGDTKVRSNQEVLNPLAYLITNRLYNTFYCYSDGALLTNLSKLPCRNNKLASLIKRRGYDRGRNVLVLSNRTKQLSVLRKLCADLGVPLKCMGLHMGSYETDRFVVYYTYDGSSKRNRLLIADSYSKARTVVSNLNNGDYVKYDIPKPLTLRLQAGESVTWEYEREQYKPSQNELDDITNSCQIIFATYEIFSKGVDVPRLDMGVEALPSGNLKQPLGRVLRLSDNKPTPEWYAIHDTVDVPVPNEESKILNTFFNGKTSIRVAALKKAKAKVSYQ